MCCLVSVETICGVGGSHVFCSVSVKAMCAVRCRWKPCFLFGVGGSHVFCSVSVKAMCAVWYRWKPYVVSVEAMFSVLYR